MFKNKKYFFIFVFLAFVSCKKNDSVPEGNKDAYRELVPNNANDTYNETSTTADPNFIVRPIDLQKDTITPVNKPRMLDLTKFKATQSSTNYGAGARFAIDGNVDADFRENDLFNSVTHTRTQYDPWWQVDLETPRQIDHIIVWNRTDDNVGHRLNNYVLEILDEAEAAVFTYRHEHNYKGTSSFVSDTVSSINTLGRYVKIRLETQLRNSERLSIAEIQLFTVQEDKDTNGILIDSNKKENGLENSLVESFQNLGLEGAEVSDSVVTTNNRTKDKSYHDLIDTKDMNLLDLTKFKATQSSTNYGAGARFAIDGNVDSDFKENDLFNSVTHTRTQYDPWWQVDLETPRQIDHIVVWNRTDDNVGHRLNNYVLEILDETETVVFTYRHEHNYKGWNSFVRDTIYGVHTSGRFIRIRLDTMGREERLSIAEVQLFTVQKDEDTNRILIDSNKKKGVSENSLVEPFQKLRLEGPEPVISVVKTNNRTKYKYYRDLINTKDMNLLDLTKFKAIQSSTNYGAGARFAIDGNKDSDMKANDLFNSVTHTLAQRNPWWQVDLEKSTEIKRIVVWNRTDGNVGFRLNNYILEILDESQKVIYQYKHQHNYKGWNSFVRDTIYGVHTSGRFMRIRLDTGGREERLSIAEVQLFN